MAKDTPKRAADTEEREGESTEIKKSTRIHSAVISVRNPSKKSETICKQLRKILSPDCLFKLETNPKLQDVADVSAQLLMKQIVYISEHEITIASLPNGPTHTFKIVEYEDNFKNYANDIYTTVPFVTFGGKSSMRTLFLDFGSTKTLAKRALHFHFKDGLVYVRHYVMNTEDTEDNFVVRMKEIGPRFTLKLLEVETGVFPKMKVDFKSSRRRRAGFKPRA